MAERNLSHYILERVYEHPLLLRLYKAVKFLYGFVTGTTELHRIVIGATREQGSDDGGKQRVAPEVIYKIDRCIRHSSKLGRELGLLLSDVTSKVDVPALTRALMVKKRLPVPGETDTPHARLLSSALDSIRSLYLFKSELTFQASKATSLSDKVDLDKLSQLYHRLTGEKAPEGKAEAWKELGFQGTDPSTDFRGTGRLGLSDLAAFCSRYPVEARRTLEVSKHPVAWFPWAVAGINFTSFMLVLLERGKMDFEFYQGAHEREIWDNVFAYVFVSFCRTWEARRDPEKLSVLDFNRVFADYKWSFETELAEGRRFAIEVGISY